MRPHRRQPTRLPRPWDSPGKNTGVGCHFLLQCMKVKSQSEVTQSCLTLSDLMTAAHQAPPSMGFSRQEYWSEVPLPSPGKHYWALNQIPNDYRVEVRNRFQGVDLIDRRLMNYRQRFITLYRRQEARLSPRKRNAEKQNCCLRRSYKELWKEEKQKAKEKRKDIPTWMQNSKL